MIIAEKPQKMKFLSAANSANILRTSSITGFRSIIEPQAAHFLSFESKGTYALQWGQRIILHLSNTGIQFLVIQSAPIIRKIIRYKSPFKTSGGLQE